MTFMTRKPSYQIITEFNPPQILTEITAEMKEFQENMGLKFLLTKKREVEKYTEDYIKNNGGCYKVYQLLLEFNGSKSQKVKNDFKRGYSLKKYVKKNKEGNKGEWLFTKILMTNKEVIDLLETIEDKICRETAEYLINHHL